LVAREETKLNLWNHTGQIIDELATPPQKLFEASLFFSPDGQLLLVSGITQTMVVEMATFQPQHTLNTEGVTQWAFHPTEPRLMGYGNAQVYEWDLQTGLLLSQRPFFAGNYEEQQVETLTRWFFNFHGRVAASTHSERRDYDAGYSFLRLYDTQTLLPIGPELARLGGGVAMNPSGTLLAATRNGRVILWPLEADVWVKKACYTVNRNFTEAEWQLYFGNQPYRRTCPQFPRP
jgi:WD40 repeat protein